MDEIAGQPQSFWAVPLPLLLLLVVVVSLLGFLNLPPRIHAA